MTYLEAIQELNKTSSGEPGDMIQFKKFVDRAKELYAQVDTNSEVVNDE